MDDPSDPPPSIDSAEFRAPGAAHTHTREGGTPPPARAQSPPAPLPPLAIPHRAAADDVEGEEGAHGHAPPPYRVPGMGMEMDLDMGHEDHEDHGRVVHPPPYMDLVHESQH